MSETKNIFKGHELETFEKISEIATASGLQTVHYRSMLPSYILVQTHTGEDVFKFNQHVIDGYFILTWHDAELLERL